MSDESTGESSSTRRRAAAEPGADLIQERDDGFFEVDGMGPYDEETAKRVARQVARGRSAQDPRQKPNPNLGGTGGRR